MKLFKSHGSLLSAAVAISLFHLWLLSTYVAGHTAPARSPSQNTTTNPWQSFYKLAGSHKGDNVDGLSDLKQYLQQFGYISNSSTNFTNSFDDNLESAVKKYQQNFNLNATGVLDNTTVQTMVIPRCGVADIINGTTSMNSGKPTTSLHIVSHYTFFEGTPKWPESQYNLSYAFWPLNNLEDNEKAVFSRAFQRWAAVTPLNFTETNSYLEADIKIGFYARNHGDGESFDGVLGTLAHAFSPTTGWLHMDGEEDWVVDEDVTKSSSTIAVDMESVAVHEIGHVLGLGHSSVEEAIMYPSISARTRKTELADDDIQGIQKLYGDGGDTNYHAPAPSPSNTARDFSDGGVPIMDCHWRVTMVMGAVASLGLLL